MKNRIFLICTAFLGIFSSCSTDDENTDTQKPNIYLNSPSDEQIFEPGDTIMVDAEFTDNQALGSYKIEIHFAGDGHHHKTEEEGVEWFYTETGMIAGTPKVYHLVKEIAIPTAINGEPLEHGHYHLGIYLIDAAGNEKQEFIEIEIH